MLGLLRFHRLALALRASLVVLLSAGLALAAGSAGAESGNARAAEPLLLEARDGTLLHALSYRPKRPATRGVILAGGPPPPAGPCWGTLPQELCAQGYEVLLPDLAGPAGNEGREPVSPEDLEHSMTLWLESATLGGAFGDSVACLGVLCMGQAGWAARQLIAEERRARACVWLSPLPSATGGRDWAPPSDAAVRLLFVAAADEIESSVLAGDLFSRFNETAELRLFSRVEGGCGLLTRRLIRDGLIAWLGSVCPERTEWRTR